MEQLVASPRWSSVVTVGRRAVDPPPPEPTPGKLRQIVCNMDQVETDPEVTSELSKGVDSVFCALGTTRAAAGSAAAFKKVDFDYVAAAARAAKAANAPHFSLVSAQGANAGLWASDLSLFHGLLYSKTKGLAEQAVQAQHFPYVTIMRPGLLNREATTRSLEKVALKVMSSIPVSQVAAFMIHDAEVYHDEANSGKRPAAPVRKVTMKEMQAFGK